MAGLWIVGFLVLVLIVIVTGAIRVRWARSLREHRRASGTDMESALADYLKGMPFTPDLPARRSGRDKGTGRGGN